MPTCEISFTCSIVTIETKKKLIQFFFRITAGFKFHYIERECVCEALWDSNTLKKNREKVLLFM